MKLLLLTLGTRGDVQPFVALGKVLQARGHSVRICANQGYQDFIESHGLDYAFMNNELLDLTANQNAQSENWQTALKRIKAFKPIFARLLVEQWQAAQGVEAVVYHPQAIGGYHLAEALNIPGIMADPLPMYVPTGEFPQLVMPELGLGQGYNRWTYRFLTRMLHLTYGGVVNRWRQQTLGLKPFKSSPLLRPDGRPVPALHAFSQAVIPKPADWPKTAHVTGYWFLDESPNWQAPPALQAFLEAGPPPIYIGFGSLGTLLKAEQGDEMLEALQQTGQRFVVISGWLKPNRPLPETIFEIDAAPHDWLFPKMAAIVHHGGAGTTAAVLRAGKAAIVCPLTADQPFWARRMNRLGVAPAPLALRRLKPSSLAAAIRELNTQPAFETRACQLGEDIRIENGAETAAKLIECYSTQTFS